MRGPRAAPALIASFRMLRNRAAVTLALGAAVILSLLSVCCGLGLLTTPWFLCELFAVQLSLCTGRAVARGLSFIPAGVIMLGAVLLVSAVAWIALLGTGPGASIQTPRLFNLTTLMQSGGFYALIASGSALLVISPLLYAPLILIEQQTAFDRALVESVRLMVTRGVFASVGLSLLAHIVQVAPLLLATLVGLWLEPSQLALFALASTPLLCVSVPLGQGMIVWTYTQVRELRQAEAEPDDPATRAALRVTGRYARIWSVLILLPIASLVLLGLSLVRPSRVQRGSLPPGNVIASIEPHAGQPARVVLPDTAIEVVATPHAVDVIASDGGGAGRLPLGASGPIERLRVMRVRDAFGIELRQGGQTYTTWIDRAGVRLDDDLRLRLLDRAGPWPLLLMLGALLCTGLLSVPTLNDLGRVQRGYCKPTPRRPSADVLALDLSRSLRRARVWAAVLAPWSAACVLLALRAIGVL